MCDYFFENVTAPHSSDTKALWGLHSESRKRSLIPFTYTRHVHVVTYERTLARTCTYVCMHVCARARGIRYPCLSTCTVLRIMSPRVSGSMALTCARACRWFSDFRVHACPLRTTKIRRTCIRCIPCIPRGFIRCRRDSLFSDLFYYIPAWLNISLYNV